MNVFVKYVLFTTLLIAGLFVVVMMSWTNPFDKKRINPSAPQTKTDTGSTWESASLSNASVNLVIDKKALTSLLESLVPQNNKGSESVDFGKIVKEEKISWNVSRKQLSVSTNNSIIVGTSISGSVQAKAKGRYTGLKLSQSGNLSAKVSIKANPILVNNWRLNPNASAGLSVDKLKVKLFNLFTVDLGSIASQALQKPKDDLILELNKMIVADRFLEKFAKELHAKLCTVFPLDLDGTQAWLVTKPIEWSAVQPVLDAQGLTMNFGVKLQTYGSTLETPRKPECAFPKNLTIKPERDSDTINIALPAHISWETIRKLSNKSIVEQKKGNTWVYAVKNRSLELNQLEIGEIRADGTSVLMEVVFDGILNSWLKPTFAGKVWVSVRPELNSEDQSISLNDVELDIASKNSLSVLSAAQSILEEMLKHHIENLEPISIREIASQARQLANISLAKIVADVDQANISLKNEPVTTIGLKDIHVDDGGLTMLLGAEGILSLNVSDIKL